MTTTKTLPTVCITCCDKCGDESYGLAPATGVCPRCRCERRTPRFIARPAVATVVRALREQASERQRAMADDIFSAITQVRSGALSGRELERRTPASQSRSVARIMAAAALTDADEHRLAAIRIACA